MADDDGKINERFYSPMKVSIGGKLVFDPDGDDKTAPQTGKSATEAVRKLVQRRRRLLAQRKRK